MGSNSIPLNTLSDESINRGLVCEHMHFITRTQKILTFMSKTGECRQQKHTQHAPSTKTECDYLNGWIKNGHIRKNLTQKVVNPRDIAGERRRRRRRSNITTQAYLPLAVKQHGGTVYSIQVSPGSVYRHLVKYSFSSGASIRSRTLP